MTVHKMRTVGSWISLKDRLEINSNEGDTHKNHFKVKFEILKWNVLFKWSRVLPWIIFREKGQTEVNDLLESAILLQSFYFSTNG